MVISEVILMIIEQTLINKFKLQLRYGQDSLQITKFNEWIQITQSISSIISFLPTFIYHINEDLENVHIIQYSSIYRSMLRFFPNLRFSYTVLKASNGTTGLPLPHMPQHYLADPTGNRLSFWTDVPPNLRGDEATCCIEVPKEISNKYEVIKELPFHPIMQDTKKNVFDKKLELRYYAQFPLFNYGFIPQTWEQNLIADEQGLMGDEDPIDICDLSTSRRSIGEVFRGKILGSFCLVDQGELDWKVLVVDAEEAKRDGIRGLDHYPSAQLKAIMRWFKTIKLFDGKQANHIAHNEKLFSTAQTVTIIEGTHNEYAKLLSSSEDVYQELRRKFKLERYVRPV